MGAIVVGACAGGGRKRERLRRSREVRNRWSREVRNRGRSIRHEGREWGRHRYRDVERTFSGGRQRYRDVLRSGTTTDVSEDGEKEKDDTRKLTGAPNQGPEPKFCHTLRCRRSKPDGLGMMLLSAGDQDVAKSVSGFSTRKTMSDAARIDQEDGVGSVFRQGEPVDPAVHVPWCYDLLGVERVERVAEAGGFYDVDLAV